MSDKPIPPKPAAVADSDDSEDDLDDLDDLLDEFSNPKAPTAAAAAPGTSSSAAGAAAAAATGGGLDPDFAKTLEMGMADLLSEIDNSPELKLEFDKLVKELNDATAAAPPVDPAAPPPAAPSSSRPAAATAGPSSAASAGPSKPKSFADTINQTMNRMEHSSADISSSLADEESDDFLAEMLKQMSGTLGAGGTGSDEDLSKMLLGIMEQLTNKEILYEPMKELGDKFPVWIEKNKESTSAEDMKRYEDQARLVKDIVERFESKTYSDDNAADREFIVDRMQKMQASGTPPQDLMDGLTEGGLDALPDLDSCGIQ